MKRLFFISLCVFASLGVRAQIAEAWLAMPDSLCPYLSEQQRLSMLQYARAGLNDTIENQLEGRSFFEEVALAENRLVVRMTPNLLVSLSIDSTSNGPETICIRETVCAPICATVSSWYDFAWNLLFRLRDPWELEQTEEEKIQHF